MGLSLEGSCVLLVAYSGDVAVLVADVLHGHQSSIGKVDVVRPCYSSGYVADFVLAEECVSGGVFDLVLEVVLEKELNVNWVNI